MSVVILAISSAGKDVFLALMNSSLQMALLILLVWSMIRVFRLRSATTRYYLWSLAVFGILALPLLGALLPGVSIPIVRSGETTIGPIYPQGMPTVGEDSIGLVNTETAAPDVSREAPGRKNFWTSVFRPLRQLGLISIISLVWFVIALFMLCRLIRSYVWLRHFRKRSQKVAEGPILEIISRLKERMSLTRRIDVFISSNIHSPTSFGLFSTAIILPENLTNNGDEELEMVLSHEMAHAKRHDYLVNLFQRILQSVFFFHPLFHIANRRLTREREHICDDWVIQATGKRDDYAECLVGLVENAYYPRSISVAMMGHQHNISRRVDMIIDSSRGIVTRISRKAGISVFLLGCVLLPMLATTQLVYTVEPEEPVEPVPGIMDTEERFDILEGTEPAEEEEGRPMKLEKKVKVAGIPDLNLGAAIREAIGKPEGAITESDLQAITELVAAEKNIQDISGIERCINLTTLNLNNNQIVDITPLSNLTNLERLFLIDNPISDMKPLSKLTRLTNLNLGGTGIGDLAFLANLTRLESTNLDVNQISDITPLAGLTNLAQLSLIDNQITDIISLSKLTNLEALRLRGNPIEIDSDDLALLSKLTNLTSLDISDNNIRDITGIEGCVNLERLMLGTLYDRSESSNDVEDISPLKELTNLVELSLASNKVSNIEPLSGLTNLTWVNLNNNQITDAAPLAKLTNLERLQLKDNPIGDVTFLPNLTNLTLFSIWDLPADDIDGVLQMLSDFPNLTRLSLCRCGITNLTPLSKLTGLISLELWGNQISDLSPLSDLTELEWLVLGNDQISDITPLAGLTNLTTLALNKCQITDITPVSGLTKLTSLELRSNPVADIEPLADLTELGTLYLTEAQVSDISVLSNLTNLESLELWENQIRDIAPLSDLTNLTWLSLFGNEISDLEPLANLTNVTMLVLHDNQISDITPLSGLTSVDTLWLRGNQIQDISPLSGLSNLLKLRLEDNQISDITPLSNLTKLFRLWLGENQVSNITPLSNLTDLRVLGLESNQITDISPLVDNSGIGENNVVELKGNPLNDEAYNTQIPALEKRNVDVRFDPKE
ncbi:leucine-rich repeat domain-containing protein [Candidatus Poribacteria bacterium]